MKDRAVVRLARLVVTFGGVLAAFGVVVTIAIAGLGAWWSADGGFMALFALFFGVFVWFVIERQPRNRLVWIMANVAFGAGCWLAGLGGALLIVREDPTQVASLVGSSIVPATLVPAAAWILMLTQAYTTGAMLSGFAFSLLLFPDGRLPSRRWRWAGALAMTGIGISVVGSIVAYRPGNTAIANQDPLFRLGGAVVAIAAVLSLAALFLGLRRSTGPRRDQYKWVVWGAAIFVPTGIISILFQDTTHRELQTALLMLGGLAFISSLGIAVGRYRLFNVDVVISRTVVVAGLAGFITAVYAVLVGAVGLVVGFGTEATLPLSIAATVVVALAFQPLRERMRRWADRLVYGERATPYEVLSRLSEQMRDAVAIEDVVPRLTELVALGTGARRATVWMRHDDRLRASAVWPADELVPDVERIDGDLQVPGVDHLALVEHDGELLGAVSVSMPAGEGITGAAQRLVDDVASQAGLVLRNTRLIGELRSSRQRLVAAQDEERRRLERNLHDGAQQQFVAVKMKASVARQLAAEGDNERAVEVLGEVLSDVDSGVESLRDLAHGIYPPLLEAEGLPAALRSHTRRSPIPVSTTTEGVGRYSPDIEAATYFCVLEALQNAIKYSQAKSVSVSLTYDGSELVFEVSDDGRGFDPHTQGRGRGLANMTDRLDALGGTLAIQSAPGQGTKITGMLHVQPQAPVSTESGR